MIRAKDFYGLPILAVASYAALTGNERGVNLALCVLWLCVIFGILGVVAFIATRSIIGTDGIESLTDAGKSLCEKAKREHQLNGGVISFRAKVRTFNMMAPFLIMATAGYVIPGVIGCVVAVCFLAARMTLAETVIKAESKQRGESGDE